MIAYTSKHSKLFSKTNLHFILTDRYGGVSENQFYSLNLGLNTKDNNVIKNREIFKNEMQINKLYYINQEHGNKIIHLKKQNSNNEYLGYGDGIICNTQNLYTMITIADCNPIILFSQKKQVFTLLHAGRAGLEKKIITNASKLINSNDTIAFIGASIRKCCYEINGELLEIYNNKYSKFLTYINNKYYLDMITMIKDELSANNIYEFEILEQCTCCNDIFFSYRRDKECGRFALVCAIK